MIKANSKRHDNFYFFVLPLNKVVIVVSLTVSKNEKYISPPCPTITTFTI